MDNNNNNNNNNNNSFLSLSPEEAFNYVFPTDAENKYFLEYKKYAITKELEYKLNLSLPLRQSTIDRIKFRIVNMDILAKAQQYIISKAFGKNQEYFEFSKCYTLDSKLCVKEIPLLPFEKDLQRLVFPFEDDLRKKMMSCKKKLLIPPRDHIEEGQRYIEYILVGKVNNETTLFRYVEHYNLNHATFKSSGVCLGVLPQGRKLGYFDLVRQDYDARYEHPNKFDIYGNISPQGDVMNDALSHFHYNTFENDMIFGASSSPDITYCDKDYKDFRDMISNFCNSMSIDKKQSILTRDEVTSSADETIKSVYDNKCLIPVKEKGVTK